MEIEETDCAAEVAEHLGFVLLGACRRKRSGSGMRIKHPKLGVAGIGRSARRGAVSAARSRYIR